MTVAVLNLDAAVVLLTPLYVRVARRTGLDPVALAFQPVLLACLASSFLPVSNLTNLIAAHQADLGTSDFLVAPRGAEPRRGRRRLVDVPARRSGFPRTRGLPAVSSSGPRCGPA